MRPVAAALVVTCGIAWLSPALNAASADDGWSRVRSLAAGSEIIVTVTGSQPAARYLISADEFVLTELNLTDRRLSSDAKSALRDIAETHPDYFSAAQMGRIIEDDGVRIAQDGVFVANRRIAPLEQIAETIPRTSVRRIQRRDTRLTHVAHDAGIGFLIGAAAGIALATLKFRGHWKAAVGYFGGPFSVGGAEIGALHGAMKELPALVTVYEEPLP
jgi:hypothetical protein